MRIVSEVEHTVKIIHGWKSQSGLKLVVEIDQEWDEINITLQLKDRRHAPIQLTREELEDLQALLNGVGGLLTQGKNNKNRVDLEA